MSVGSLWKLLSALMGIAAFIVVSVLSYMDGDDLIWAVGKALLSFIICWFVLGNLGAMVLSLAGGKNEHAVFADSPLDDDDDNDQFDATFGQKATENETKEG